MSHPTVTDFFEKDHDRLDGLFKTYQQLKQSDFPKARQAFVDFKFGLQRHIVWEEEILFPVFEEKTGMRGDQGPTAVMRREHREIKAALEEIHSKVAAGRASTDDAEVILITLLSQHNLKEEKILYPAIDRSLKPDDLKSVFRRMEEIPRERYEQCCGA